MKLFLRIFSFKHTLILSALILLVLCVFSFYGPYTGVFYFLKASNYVFPTLTVLHFVYMYVLWFKMKEEELTDPQMRKLEYGIYLMIIVYLYKAGESFYILNSYVDYENHMLPEKFQTIGLTISILYVLLLLLTPLTIWYRKQKIGNYNFDEINHIDSWE